MKDLCFVANGLYASTSHIVGNDAFITVEVAVENQTQDAQETWIDIHMHQLIDTAKYEIAEEPGIKAAGAIKLVVPAKATGYARTVICVENAVQWTLDKPILYVVEAVLYKPVAEGEALPNPKLIAGLAKRQPHAMKMLDFEETRFGIRTISLDARNGMCINGQAVVLNAKNVGMDASKERVPQSKEEAFEKAYQYAFQIKKEGYNAVLIHSKEITDEFLDACNRLGIMILDGVTSNKDICRVRSFPAVVAWVACEKGIEEQIRMLDAMRPIGGIASADYGRRETGKFDRMEWNDVTEELCAAWDFVGYPKEYTQLEEAYILFPNRAILLCDSSVEKIEECNKRYKNVIGGYYG